MNHEETLTLTVTGQTITAHFDTDLKDHLWIPLLTYWSNQSKTMDRPYIIYLAAPAGAGKSTLAAYLSYIATTMVLPVDLQVLPMDGFHHTNAYLSTHTITRDGQTIVLSTIKGCPESFDITSLTNHIASLYTTSPLPWPIYDRNLHEPIENAIDIHSKIILIEGNYLLLDHPQWSTLSSYADQTIFITTDPKLLQTRLVNRKALSMHYRKALAFYNASDAYNVTTVLDHSKKSDILLQLQADDDYRLVKPSFDVIESWMQRSNE